MYSCGFPIASHAWERAEMSYILSLLHPVLAWLTSEMPGETLTVVLTVVLVPAVQNIYARRRFKGFRASLLDMMDKHFALLQAGVLGQDAQTIATEAAILDELMRPVAATMRPEMIRSYNNYLRDLIRNQGGARDLKYLSARLFEVGDDACEEQYLFAKVQTGFEKWQEYFLPFREHFL